MKQSRHVLLVLSEGVLSLEFVKQVAPQNKNPTASGFVTRVCRQCCCC